MLAGGLKMKAIIVSGGTIDQEFALGFIKDSRPDYLIAADRGLEFFWKLRQDRRRRQEGLVQPDYIVGDFDSIDPRIIETYRREGRIPIDTYDPMKDLTDTMIAAERAIVLGADELVFLGVTGTRLDHVLASVYNLKLFRARGITGRIVDKNNRVTMPARKPAASAGETYTIRREDAFGKYISLFPAGEPVTGITLEGFLYPLSDFTLSAGDGGLCVSNELAPDAEAGRISWQSGDLLIIESRD